MEQTIFNMIVRGSEASFKKIKVGDEGIAAQLAWLH